MSTLLPFAVVGAQAAVAAASRRGSRAPVLGQPARPSGRGVVEIPSTWAQARATLEASGFEREDAFTQELEEREEAGKERWGDGWGPADAQEAREATWHYFSERFDELEGAVWDFTNPLRLYRSIHAPSLEEIRTRGAGIFWSWDPDAAKAHWAGEGKGFTMVAEVDPVHIDWGSTIFSNVHIPEEREVTLNEGAPIRILRIVDARGHTVSAQQRMGRA